MLWAEKAQQMAEQEAELPDNAAYVYQDSIGKMQKEISNTTSDAASYWSMV